MSCLGLAACIPEPDGASLDPAPESETGDTGGERAAGALPLAPELELAWDAAVRRSPAPRSVLTAGAEPTAPRVLVSSRALVDAQGELLQATAEGALDEATRQRVARPYRHLDESTIYDMSAWFTSHDGKVMERGYEVYATPNPTPLPPQDYTGPVIVSDNLEQHLERVGPDGRMQLALRLRNFPEWDIPLPADERTASPADVEAAATARTQALDERSALFDILRAPIERELAELGGKVIDGSSFTGWLYVDVPAASLPQLRERRDIQQIHSSEGHKLHSGGSDLGEYRNSTRANAEDFYSAGHYGDEPNPARHSAGAVVIGILEPRGFESEARMFRSGPPGSSTRVVGKYHCGGASPNICSNTSTLADPADPATGGQDNHGTLVASIALGDYTRGQADGVQIGDPAWTNSSCTSNAQCASGECIGFRCAHTSAWEVKSSGVARRAKARLYGWFGSPPPPTVFEAAAQATIALATTNGDDIISNSWSWGDTACSTSGGKAISSTQQAIEAAFDDGVFIAVMAGNVDGDNATTCGLMGPQARVPKAFTVNAYDSQDSNCSIWGQRFCVLDRDSCPIPMGSQTNGCSARGGLPARHPIETIATPDRVTAIDVVAPNSITSVTRSGTGPDGVSGAAFSGTSAATPHAAGAAALVKDWLLDHGQSWINSPGWLHAVMLHMADRHYSIDPSDGSVLTQSLSHRADPWYGVGRLKLRLFEPGQGLDPFAFSVTTFTRSSPGSVVYHPFGQGPLPPGIDQIKCTAFQVEDLSEPATWDFVSNLRLTVKVRNTSGSTCGGSTYLTRISQNSDLKKVAALDDNAWSFDNKCVEVTLDWIDVTARGLTVQTVCSFAGVEDDE